MDQISVNNVSYEYETENRRVLAVKEISFSVEPSEFLCVLGPSGCGKTTILNMIAGFLAPTRGEILFGGRKATATGVDRVELYTEPYAALAAEGRGALGLAPYVAAAAAARAQGLGINAGHDLNLDNLDLFLDGVRPIDEVSIGHALIADALAVGLPSAVRSYLAICTAPRADSK